MAKREREGKWSLLLLRGPGHRVKQLQVSVRTLVLLPVAAAIAVAGCVAGLELRALYRIHALELRLAAESALRAADLSDRNGETSSLTRQLAAMTRQAGDLQTRVAGMNALERKLRQFIDRYDSSKPPDTANRVPQSLDVVNSFNTSNDITMAGAVQDFEELSRLLHDMSKSMESNLQKAEQRRADLAAVPSGWPTVSRMLTSGFGYRTDPLTGRMAFHAGIDIAGAVGDPVYAAGDGVVTDTGFEQARGNYIIITHRAGLESWYLHLRKIGVAPGAKISRGRRIGELGNTGRSTGAHLHFQIVSRDEPVNPLGYLRLVKED